MKKLIIITLTILWSLSCLAQEKTVYNEIRGSGEDLQDGDTVRLHVDKNPVHVFNEQFYESLTTIVKNKAYLFRWKATLPIQSAQLRYRKLKKDRSQKLAVINGISVIIQHQNDSLSFSGTGGDSYAAQVQIERTGRNVTQNYIPFTPERVLARLMQYDTIANLKTAVLEKYRLKITPDLYSYLKNSIKIGRDFGLYSDFDFHVLSKPKLSAALIANFEKFLEISPEAKITDGIDKIPLNLLADFLILRYFARQKAMGVVYGNKIDAIRYFSWSDPGVLREGIMIKLVHMNKDRSAAAGRFLGNLIPEIKNVVYQQYIQAQVRLTAGNIAPDFVLTDTQGRHVRLNDLRGKVVVLDFWFTGCPGCLKNAPYMLKAEQYFKGKPVIFVSISTDRDKGQWLKSIQRGNYASPEITNLYTEGKGNAHGVIKDYFITGYPSFHIITKDGVLQDVPLMPAIDDAASLKAAIEKLL